MSEEQCSLLRELSSSVLYQSIMSVKFVLCAVGVSGVCYQWRKQGVRFLIHNNTKIVFKFFYALNIIHTSFFGLFFFIELIRLRFDCPIMNYRTVLLSKGLAISASIASHYLISIISFERLFSSLFPAYFERNSSKILSSCLSIAMILIFWIVAMSKFSNGFTLFGDFPVAVFDSRIEANSRSFDELMHMGMITSILLLIVFSIEIYLNFIRKPSGRIASLSISYQRSENRRVILIILPIEIATTLLSLATTSALMMKPKIIDVTHPMNHILFGELFNFPILFPLVLVIIIELRVARRVRPSVVVPDDQVDHFDSLRQAWD